MITGDESNQRGAVLSILGFWRRESALLYSVHRLLAWLLALGSPAVEETAPSNTATQSNDAISVPVVIQAPSVKPLR
jgi:hypothetical protein